jgi:hypothetical protein
VTWPPCHAQENDSFCAWSKALGHRRNVPLAHGCSAEAEGQRPEKATAVEPINFGLPPVKLIALVTHG